MTEKTWMIYGAYGYSGELIAREASKRGFFPILAGRNEEKTAALATHLGLNYRHFSLESSEKVKENLKDIDLVIHCAGPFSQTARPMIEACIESKTHYFDITGEIDVFELAHSKVINEKAKAAGVVICPGIGFDVIPTDCIAARLSEAMPDATSLFLGFSSRSGMSPGTSKTMVESLGQGTRWRKDGVICRTNLITRQVDFGKGPCLSMLISWGDVSTAFHTTGIKNIGVFVPVPRKKLRIIHMLAYLRPLLNLGWFQSYMKKKAGMRKGPNEEKRKAHKTLVWGEAKNDAGKTLFIHLETANGYDVTIDGPLAIVQHFITKGFDVSGSITPSKLMGPDFICTLPGSNPQGTLKIQEQKKSKNKVSEPQDL